MGGGGLALVVTSRVRLVVSRVFSGLHYTAFGQRPRVERVRRQASSICTESATSLAGDRTFDGPGRRSRARLPESSPRTEAPALPVLDDVGPIDLSAPRAPNRTPCGARCQLEAVDAFPSPSRGEGLAPDNREAGSKPARPPPLYPGTKAEITTGSSPARERRVRSGKVRRRTIREPGDLLRRDRPRPPGWRDVTAARRVRLAALPSIHPLRGRSLAERWLCLQSRGAGERLEWSRR